jgi:hypothetical protein
MHEGRRRLLTDLQTALRRAVDILGTEVEDEQNEEAKQWLLTALANVEGAVAFLDEAKAIGSTH